LSKKRVPTTSNDLPEGLDLALKQIAKRERSRAEVARFLSERGIDPDPVLLWLEAKGMVKDDRLAEEVLQAQLRKGRGVHRQNAELLRRGLEPTASGENDLARAREWAEQRLSKGDSLARIGRGLSARGYDEDCVRSVMEELESR
jgi:SOS response regulatory protein OraA/RecX